MSEETLGGLLEELERVKARHGKGVYKINARYSRGTVEQIKRYFKENKGYELNLRQCSTCKNTWDVIVTIQY